jgi:chitosanase
MNLSAQQKAICEQVINVFETGSAQGNYSMIATFADGPHGVRQVTYGRSQTTEYGNLEELVQMYVDANGKFAAELRPFIEKIGVTPLVDISDFKQLLRDAGKSDAIMQRTQDAFFEKRYFQPAMKWADTNGFTLPLSGLVIYDSFIHSGGILDFLRKRFPEAPPAKGGNEKTWISQYVDARQQWLATHSNAILQKTVYRTKCFKLEIGRNNWDLSQLPVDANGTKVFAAAAG